MNNVMSLFDTPTFFEPVNTVNQLQKEIDRLFDDFMSPTTSNWRSLQAITAPACDVEETESHYLVSMDLPGVSKDQIQIETVGNHLKVWAERKESRKEKNATYRSSERRFGRWERHFALPESVQSDHIEASYEDGVLRIALPKAESAKPRQIKVQDGRTGFFGKLLGGSDKKAEVEVKSEKVG